MLNFVVRGMTCGHCQRAVTRAVHSVEPEAQVVVDLTSGRVEVGVGEADAAEQAALGTAIAAAIRAEGYEVVIAT